MRYTSRCVLKALPYSCRLVFADPDKPITEKPIQVRMGGGKGNVEYYIAEVKPGKVLYEMDGVPESLAREAFELAAAKLPIPTTFVVRQVGQ